ncbi:unnamed protein product, partial [marine sediment metagenome]
MLERWDVIRERKVQRPTKSELERFYREMLIDKKTLKAELTKRGYEEGYVIWYTLDLMYRLTLELEEAQKKSVEEFERIRAKEYKSEYDVIIAQVKVYIAEV